MGEEDTDWEVDPCVPKTNEELLTKLTKFDAGHVKVPGCCTEIPYTDTVIIWLRIKERWRN